MNKKLIGRIAAILFAILLALSPLMGVVAHAAPIRSPIQSQSVDSDSTFWDRLMGRTELTEYEKEQQELPLLQRDRWIAEPGILAVAIVILIWFVWKMRRDIRKIKKDNEEYDRLQRETAENLAALKDDEDDEEDWEDEDDEEEDFGDEDPDGESLDEEAAPAEDLTAGETAEGDEDDGTRQK